MKVLMLKSQMQLMLLWAVGSTILFILVWLQILFGHYGQNSREAVEWLLPSIVPTVSLVTGVWAKNALKKPKTTRKVDRTLHRVVLGVSVFYLSFIAAVFLVQPFAGQPPLAVLRTSSLILAPFQGIVCALIGIFFSESPESSK